MQTNSLKIPKKYYLLKIFSAFIFMLAFAACRVSLVPAYSAELETQIVNAAKNTDLLYLQMIEAPADKKNFSNWSDKYLAAETDINSILLKDQARTNDSDLIKPVIALRSYFINAMNDHKIRNTLSNAELLIYNEQLKAFWLPVLKEEIALSKAK